jgi:hypothetical protein
MEAPAWTTYAAVVIASQAAAAGSLESTGSLREYLQDSGNLIDVGKESPVYFVSDDQQMRQELYVIEPRADASWGRTVAARTALAGIVDVVSDLGHVVRQQGPATCGSH